MHHGQADGGTLQEVVEARGRTECEQGQCQTKHDWDDAGDGDDKNRVQMTNDERDDANESQALAGGDITKYRANVAGTRYLTQDRPDLKCATLQVCAMSIPSVSDLERFKRKVSREEAANRVPAPMATKW